MASCEKCWKDSHGSAKHYTELIIKRKNHPCSPEEQAGEDAGICPECNRKTIHQHVHYCVNPECKNYHLSGESK